MRHFLLIVILALAWPLADARAAGVNEAREFVDDLGKKVLGIMDSSAAEAQKQKQLQQLFTENVDIDWMGQFVLGRAWQQATPEQRSRYLQAYRDYLLAHYTSNFTDYNGSNYKITSVEDKGNGEFSVNMQINTPGQKQDVLAGYRLRNAGNQFKLSDIIIEGVSLITTERSEFTAVVQKDGIDALINSLEQKKQQEQKKISGWEPSPLLPGLFSSRKQSPRILFMAFL